VPSWDHSRRGPGITRRSSLFGGERLRSYEGLSEMESLWFVHPDMNVSGYGSLAEENREEAANLFVQEAFTFGAYDECAPVAQVLLLRDTAQVRVDYLQAIALFSDFLEFMHE